MYLQKIKNMLEINKSQYTSLNSFFHSIGLDIDKTGTICQNSYIEVPTRVYRATVQRGHIAAFSYIGRDVFIHDTTIKRYCSIAKSVNIGHGNHPTTWLSTNPFTYQNSFRIKTGNLFPFHDDYISYQVPQINRTQLKKDVDLPPNTIIGNDVWIGVGALILPNITIGDGAIIGGGSVVTKDVPPYAIAVGNPAKIIKYRFTEKQIEELLSIQWWDYSPWELHKANITFYDIDEAIAQLKHRIKNGILKKYEKNEMKISELSEIYKGS